MNIKAQNNKLKRFIKIMTLGLILVLHNSSAQIVLSKVDKNNIEINLGKFSTWSDVPDEIFKDISKAKSLVKIKVLNKGGIEIKPMLKGLVIRSLSQSPNDENIVYVGLKGEESGDGKVMVSKNNAKNWMGLNQGKPLSGEATDVQVIVESPHDSNVIYAGTWKNGLYRSVDKGEHFNKVENFPSSDIRSIIFQKKYKSLILVATTSHGIVSSNDGGKTWAAKSRGFLKDNFYYTWKLIQSPIDENKVYALTYGGLFVSEDFSHTWKSIINEPGFIFTAMTFKSKSTLYVANNDSTVYESVDGGESYKKHTNTIKGFINDIVVINDTVLFAGDKSLYYLDGGKLIPSNISVPFPTVSQFLLRKNDLLMGTWGNGLIKKNIKTL